MVIITIGNLAEPLETTLKMCDNINAQFCALYVKDLPDAAATAFEDGSFLFLDKKYRTHVCICQEEFRTYVCISVFGYKKTTLCTLWYVG
jgi:hypothetical protein